MTVKRVELQEIVKRGEQASFNFWNNHIDIQLKAKALAQDVLEFSASIGASLQGHELTANVARMLATEYHRHSWTCSIGRDSDPRDKYDVLTIKEPA